MELNELQPPWPAVFALMWEAYLAGTVPPCHLCLGAAIIAHVGGLCYAAADPYAGAVGKLLPSEYMRRRNSLRVEGPLSGPAALLPEVLHLRHMLWRVPDGQGMVPFYRESRPRLIDIALRVPAPPEAKTLDETYARILAAL